MPCQCLRGVLCCVVLCSLSGSSHHVHTGVALVLPRHPAAAAGSSNGKQAEPDVLCRTFSETTNVVFAELSKDLIDAYIHTGTVMTQDWVFVLGFSGWDAVWDPAQLRAWLTQVGNNRRTASCKA